MYSLWPDLSQDTINFDLEVWPTFEKLEPWLLFNDGCRPASVLVFWQLLLCVFVPRFRESAGTLNLIRLSVRPSVPLSVCPSVRHKNFNLGHNFCTIIGRALILGMCILCDGTFPMVPCRDLDGDLWPTSRSNLLPSGGPQFSEFACTGLLCVRYLTWWVLPDCGWFILSVCFTGLLCARYLTWWVLPDCGWLYFLCVLQVYSVLDISPDGCYLIASGYTFCVFYRFTLC